MLCFTNVLRSLAVGSLVNKKGLYDKTADLKDVENIRLKTNTYLCKTTMYGPYFEVMYCPELVHHGLVMTPLFAIKIIYAGKNL
jgi:hypothetical protein